ncbi:unnamed protein product [Symbiodinium sp. CCMP2592]|nr:unnamed protein product [Symbiodinium sp. CCMP2592]
MVATQDQGRAQLEAGLHRQARSSGWHLLECPDFLQIGDWRLAAENFNTFTVAHIGGQVVNFVAPSLLQTNASVAAVDCTNANSKYEPVDMPGQGRWSSQFATLARLSVQMCTGDRLSAFQLLVGWRLPLSGRLGVLDT